MRSHKRLHICPNIICVCLLGTLLVPQNTFHISFTFPLAKLSFMPVRIKVFGNCALVPHQCIAFQSQFLCLGSEKLLGQCNNPEISPYILMPPGKMGSRCCLIYNFQNLGVLSFKIHLFKFLFFLRLQALVVR